MSKDICRRPIEEWERDHLEALGLALRTARRDAHLSQADLAVAADLSERSVRRLEQGQRRTRQSTLLRLAEALAAAHPVRTSVDLLDAFLTAAGATVAPESAYQERVEGRRRRRGNRRRRDLVTRHVVREIPIAPGLVLQHHRHERRHSRFVTRVHQYFVVTQKSA